MEINNVATSDPEKAFLPFALPQIESEEIDEVVDTMKSGWLTTGPKVKQFEEEFADFVDAKHALAVNSATSGLHLALEAVGIGPGDKVLTTVYTFTASAEVIRYLGAEVVFVDIDPVTFNMDVAQVAKALAEDKTIRAIMPVHIAGQACEMDELMELAERHGVYVVEDAAHALPTTYKNRKIGSIGHVTVYSFYVTKTIATGEGGMVATDDPDIAKRIKVMRLHGISKDVFDRYTSNKPAWYYEIVAPGFKYNMPDLAAAIGIHQLRKAERFWKRRADIARQYDEGLKGLPMRTPVVVRESDKHAWHLYILQLQLDALSIDRDEFIVRMVEQGIGISVHFIPLHLQPYWKERYSLEPASFPVATDVYYRALSLPIYPKMSDGDVQRVIAAVHSVVSGAVPAAQQG